MPGRNAASPAHTGDAIRDRVLVWDVSVRVFHWLLVLTVASAWLTGGSGERWHELAGSAVAALIAFRLAWGFTGSRHSRFSDFVRGPYATLRYVKLALAGRAPRHIGHNPAGAAMIITLLAVLTTTCVTGAMQLTPAFFGIDWVETVHKIAAHSILLLIPLHVLGALTSSFAHRENLIAAMISGWKRPQSGGEASQSPDADLRMRIRGAQGLAVLLFLLSGGLATGWVATNERTQVDLPVAAVSASPEPLAQPTRSEDGARSPGARGSAPAPAPAAVMPPPQPLAASRQRVAATEAANAGSDVRFRGRLTGYWSIDNRKISVQSDARIDKSPRPGDLVEVRGRVREDGVVEVRRLRRR